MQLLRVVHCVICNNFYNQHWNWYFFVYYKYMHHNKKLPLDLIMSIKQQIVNINRKYQEINIKSQTYYFFSDMINMNDFNSSLLKIDKNSFKDIGIYTTLDKSQLEILRIMKIFIM